LKDVVTAVIQDWFDRFLVPIDDPGSRFFHVNIIFTLLFILFWVFVIQQRRGFKNIQHDFLRAVFRKRYWWNRSTKLDYKIYFLNSVFKILLFIPFLDISFRISRLTVKGLLSLNSDDMLALPSSSFYLLLFTIFAFVLDDFFRFAHHLMMHKIPWLWELHKTHHSARILTPITLYRTHPLESAMATIRNSLSTGIAIGAFIFVFNSKYTLFTVLGINLFGFVFNLLGSNLRHSHIPISFGFLEYFFISPKQHQVHHSKKPEHYDKNFGVSLSVWDALVGARVLSKNVHGPLKFGVTGEHRQTLRKVLLRS
jgi:sterol desaturase/sphingolipid hydroxylase (fatty acid hydroxylase superfamily)